MAVVGTPVPQIKKDPGRFQDLLRPVMVRNLREGRGGRRGLKASLV